MVQFNSDGSVHVLVFVLAGLGLDIGVRCTSVTAIPTTGPPTAVVPSAEVPADLDPHYLEDVSAEAVVGGNEAAPNAWPWQISLQYQDRRIGRYIHVCGGTLIGLNWAMTAAHCVDWRSGEWRVVVGEHDLNRDSGREQVMNVSGVHIHPTRKMARGYDIALLRLHSDVSLNHYVQLAYLPPSGHILTHNTTCFITGWGLTSTNGHPSARLKQVHLPLIDHRTCTRDDWWGPVVTATMICAGGGNEAGCHGDSGGPLNCEVNGTHYHVLGVASFVSSEGCDVPKKPTVFARVSDVTEWMNSVSIRYVER